MSETTKRILLIGVSAILTLIMAASGWEAYLRADYEVWKEKHETLAKNGTLTIASPHEGMSWEYRPYGEFRNIQTNRYGFRSVDFETPEKPAGTYRYAFIGDSVTLAVGAPLEETFVKRFEVLENLTGTTSGRVEALNFGIDGYNTLQVRALLTAKVLQFQPDHVIYVLCPNDFDFYAAAGYNGLYFDPPRFFIVRELESRIRSIFDIEYHRYMFWKNKTRVAEAIAEMKSILDEKGVRFSIVLVPTFWPDKSDFSDYKEIYINDFIAGTFGGSGSIVWDTLATFRKEGKPPRAFALDVWHLNKEGHALVAEYLSRKVNGRS